MIKILYKLITQTNMGKRISAYAIIHPDRMAVAKVQVYYSHRGSTRIDIYDRGTLIHQFHLSKEELKYPYGKALEGVTIIDTTIANADLSPEQQGLELLKAKGFLVIKAI